MNLRAFFFWMLLLCTVASVSHGKPKLGILSDSNLAAIADLLTVEFSSHDKVHLFERAEIQRVFTEQGLSAINAKSAAKVGQILGADGLLFLEIVRQGTNAAISARLVSVKTGAVLAFVEAPWPLQDSSDWPIFVYQRFEPFLPKLLVATKDALPISILNLRAAANTSESQRTERELTLLLLNRLMHERELFVLERRRMSDLSQEQAFAGTENSSFWNGAYLLEGTIDKTGFSREKITINARFSPPDRSTAVEIEVVGARNDLPSVIEKLARRILESLQRKSSAPEWKPEEEALKYFEEAKWALKWGMLKEAQAAAESAWALGKRDMDCALVRVRSYVAEVPLDVGGYGEGSMSFGAGTHNQIEAAVEDLYSEHGGRVIVGYSPEEKNGYKTVDYVRVKNAPDPNKLQQAQHALELYYNFSRTLPPDEPKKDSPWFVLGVEAVEASSQVLQHFHFLPSFQKGQEENLRQLRAITRSIAEWIEKSPSVHGAYFIGDRIATHDELYHTVQRGRSFFRTKAEWGCFWQETGNQCIDLYRNLAASPAFPYLHQSIWTRKLQTPLIISWGRSDKEQNSVLWNGFIQELVTSTNIVQQIEGRFLAFNAAWSDADVERTFDELFQFILTHRDLIIANNVELFSDTYNIGSMVSAKKKDPLSNRFQKEFLPQLKEINKEYWSSINQRRKKADENAAFERQKAFLEQNSTYDFFKFNEAFRGIHNYSQPQARELQPLLIAYRSKLVAQETNAPPIERGRVRSGISRVDMLLDRLTKVLNPEIANSSSPASAPSKTVSPPSSAPKPVAIQNIPVVPKIKSPTTNAIVVERFFKIPDEHLSAEILRNLTVFAHRYRDGRVWLDLRFEEAAPNGNSSYQAAAAAFHPEKETWRLIEYPKRALMDGAPEGFMGSTETGLHFEVFEDAFYLSERGRILKFGFQKKKWETLTVPVQELGQLFAVHNRLFFASQSSILELTDGGNSTRMLANTRRRPAVSALDTLESLGNPVVFAGLESNIRSFVHKQVHTWDGNEWRINEVIPALKALPRTDGTLFSVPGKLWMLGDKDTNATFCINMPPKPDVHISPSFMHLNSNRLTNSGPAPVWDARDINWNDVSAEMADGNLYIYKEQAAVTNVAGEWKITEQNGRHAELICFLRDSTNPYILPLKFDLTRGPATTSELAFKKGNFHRYAHHWMVFTPENLVIGNGQLPGCWVLPRTRIEQGIAHEREKRRQSEQDALVIKEARRTYLLQTYDTNRDGIFSAPEKSKMIEDRQWLESEWLNIDINGNGFIDGEDNLLFFDANESGTLDPNELKAIQQAVVWLGSSLLQRFDVNGDEALNESELRQLAQDEMEKTKSKRIQFNFQQYRQFDRNRDSGLDLAELEIMVAHILNVSIAIQSPTQFRPRNIPSNVEEALNLPDFKRDIEKLWQNKRAVAR